MLRSSRKRAPVIGSVVIAAFMVFVLTSTTVSAAPALSSANTTGAWRYGAVETVTVGPRLASDGWIYEGNATFGYTVTVFDNSTSSTTFELTVFRTMGLSLSIRFCDVSCLVPTQWSNESVRLLETSTSFGNFTTQGTVLENGLTLVPAVAIENSAVLFNANVTERTDVFLPSLGERGPHLGYLGANLNGTSVVSFSPALGLFPDQLSPGSSWSAESQFNESGSSEWSYYYANHAPRGTYVLGPVSGNRSLTASGPIVLQGAYPKGSSFDYNGVSYPAIDLEISAGFDVREGVIFIPSSADLFGNATQPWDTNTTAVASAQMDTLDVNPSGNGHVALVASSWDYSSGAANAADTATVTPATAGLSPATAGTANAVPLGKLQGQPQNPDQASATQQCLTAGSGCPTASGGSSPRSLVGLVVLGGVVGIVALVVALAVVARRRKEPPTLYPNAVLYPPGRTPRSAPGTAPSPPPSPPPPEDDPLSHLW